MNSQLLDAFYFCRGHLLIGFQVFQRARLQFASSLTESLKLKVLITDQSPPLSDVLPGYRGLEQWSPINIMDFVKREKVQEGHVHPQKEKFKVHSTPTQTSKQATPLGSGPGPSLLTEVQVPKPKPKFTLRIQRARRTT